MASFQTLAIILIGLVLIASLLYNASKSKNPIKRADGPENDYYRNVMRNLSSRSWITTLKMLSHFFVPFYKSEWPEITVDKLYDCVNSNQPPLLIDIRSPAEYDGTDEATSYGHIPNALSISILELESKLEDLNHTRKRKLKQCAQEEGSHWLPLIF